MKKEYDTPSVQVIELESEWVFCMSTDPMDNYDID